MGSRKWQTAHLIVCLAAFGFFIRFPFCSRKNISSCRLASLQAGVDPGLMRLHVLHTVYKHSCTHAGTPRFQVNMFVFRSTATDALYVCVEAFPVKHQDLFLTTLWKGTSSWNTAPPLCRFDYMYSVVFTEANSPLHVFISCNKT